MRQKIIFIFVLFSLMAFPLSVFSETRTRRYSKTQYQELKEAYEKMIVERDTALSQAQHLLQYKKKMLGAKSKMRTLQRRVEELQAENKQLHREKNLLLREIENLRERGIVGSQEETTSPSEGFFGKIKGFFGRGKGK